jgi:hypothetical protein
MSLDERPAPGPPVAGPQAAAYSAAVIPGGGLVHRFIACWLLSALVFFALTMAWSFATPLGAASDEPAQIIKAAAVARGEFLGQPTVPANNADRQHLGRAVMTVIVPATYGRDSDLANCYRHKPNVTAACAPGATTSGQLESATTYVGRYPPFYYLVVGLPSLVWHSSTGIYMMRVLSGAASALLLGLALAAAAVWGRSRLLVGGVVVAATPMVVFLGSVVNPSGLEITASIATWTTGLVLALDRRDEPPKGLIAAFISCACVLTVTRSLSPLWLALIVATLVCLEPGGCWKLLRMRQIRIGGVILVVMAALGTIYITAFDALAITASGIPLKSGATVSTVVNLYQARASFYLTQTVGVFGWLDTSAPWPIVFLVGLAVIGLIWLALATALRRHVAVLIGVLGIALVLPIAIDVKNALALHSDVWQSRYAMPLYVGIPLIAATLAGRRKAIGTAPARRIVVGIGVLLCGSQLVCFYVALHRYTVGINGPVSLLLHRSGGWSPPVPPIVLLGLATVIIASYAWLVIRLAGEGISRSDVPLNPDQATSSLGPVPVAT